jgi:RecA-family ATPase
MKEDRDAFIERALEHTHRAMGPRKAKSVRSPDPPPVSSFDEYGQAVESKPDGAKPAQPRFQLRRFNSIKAGSQRRYLVKGLIPKDGLVVVWGPPKCGKSFWTFDLTMHIALGWEYRGRRVQKGEVVYLALEGGKRFEDRIEAFRKRFLSDRNDDPPFYLITNPLNLIRDEKDLIVH